MSPKRWKQPPRGVVDTSVLVAGISGFRGEPTDNPSAALLAAWTDAPTFVWLLTEDILSEYLEVLERLHVRSAPKIVSLIREQSQFVRVTKKVTGIPDRDDAAFCECAESGNADFIVTLNPADFPQNKLKTKVIAPSDPLPLRGRKLRRRRRPLVIRKKQRAPSTRWNLDAHSVETRALVTPRTAATASEVPKHGRRLPQRLERN